MGFRVFRLAFLLSLWCAPSFAPSDRALGGRPCPKELSGLVDRLAENTFTYERSLLGYSAQFSRLFGDCLARLTTIDQWLDSGSGAGVALAEYHAKKKLQNRKSGYLPDGVTLPEDRAKTVGVVFAKPEEAATYEAAVKDQMESGRHRILSGRMLESVPAEEIGPTKLITDMYGPVAYTTDLTAVVNRYVDISDVGTEWFLYYGYALTYVKTRDGRTLSLYRYLREKLPEAEVIETDGKMPGGAHVRFLKKPSTRFPALRLTKLTNGKPPIRTFQEN